jgi:hypothetical protein
MAGMLPAVGVGEAGSRMGERGEKPHRARWPRAARSGSPLGRWGPSHTCRAAAPSSVPRQRTRRGSQAGSHWITEDAPFLFGGRGLLFEDVDRTGDDQSKGDQRNQGLSEHGQFGPPG